MDTLIEKHLTAFRRHLEKKRKHANTVRSYLNDCRQFLVWLTDSLGEDFSLDGVTKADIQDYRGFLLTRKTSATSVNRKLTALRQFFDFCITTSVVPQNPVSFIHGLTARPTPPLYLSKKEASLIIRASEQSTRPIDSVVTLLLLQCGMRSSEICQLTIGDLHLTVRDARIFIRGQHGKKMRFVALPTRTRAALRAYCNRERIRINDRKRRNEPLLHLTSGVVLTQQGVDHIIKRVSKAAGMADIKATMLRNTHAILALQRGVPTEEVARSMGAQSMKAFQDLVNGGDAGE